MFCLRFRWLNLRPCWSCSSGCSPDITKRNGPTSCHCVRSAFCHGHCLYQWQSCVYSTKKLDNTLDAIFERNMLPSNDAIKQWENTMSQLTLHPQVKLPPARPTLQELKRVPRHLTADQQSDVSKGSKEIRPFFSGISGMIWKNQSSLEFGLISWQRWHGQEGAPLILMIVSTHRFDFRPPYRWPAGPFSIFPIRPTSHIPNPSFACTTHNAP